MIPEIVQSIFRREQNQVTSSEEWKKFNRAYKKLDSATYDILPFDPKFNSVVWAFDIVHLISEIALSYCWMISFVEYYKKNTTPNSQPSHSDFYVTYFADNAIMRINSCRDKVALMVWAFYCPFNPEKKDEILNYSQILDRFKKPHKYCLKLTKHEVFLEQILKLNSQPFNRISEIRHSKIHRREPIIEIFGVESFHDLGYMIPLTDKNEILKFDEELKRQYPDPDMREVVKENCYIDGILYDSIRLNRHLFDFKEIEEKIHECLYTLLCVTTGCFNVLKRRSPLRKNDL
jgi:hypothetical protein